MVEMTRRPILIGTAAIFALILTAGLAYGSGWMQDTHPRHTQSVQGIGTHMNPGYGWDHHGQGWQQGPTTGNHHDAWMGNNRNRQGGSWVGMESGSRPSGHRDDHQGGTRHENRYDHNGDAHSGSGSYDHRNGSNGSGERHDCW
jgi:hypothetical protein